MTGATASGGVAPVSVIVPAFDAAAVLDVSLAWVAGQTVAPTAVIVADDASTDDTGAVARRWADKLPVEVVRLERNGGPAEARATAIDRSDTQLLALLDADDLWLPDHLETMLAAYRRRPALVTARPLNWVPGTGVASAPERHHCDVPPPERQLRVLLARNWISIGTLFSRADYDDAGGFRRQLRRSEDWDLWIRMLRRGVRVTRTEHPTLLYRIDPASLSFGYSEVESDVEVMRCAVAEAADDRERAWARRSLRRLSARLALRDALALARRERPWAARWAALRALRGRARVAVRGAGLIVAPRVGARVRDARTAQLGRRL